MSKEDFKKFVASKPELASYVNSGQITWQRFYEMYNLYGENHKIWDNYKESRSFNMNSINNLIKNVDVDSIKEHINTAQKALDFVQELTSKTPNKIPKSNITPRPINKFFED